MRRFLTALCTIALFVLLAPLGVCAAAAARLGWPKTTLIKRAEYLRTRLTSAGVPNLTGWNALPALAEYAITTGLITKDDLARIGL